MIVFVFFILFVFYGKRNLPKYPYSSIPCSQELLSPIFDNYIKLYSPQEKKEYFFTVSEVLSVLLVEFQKRGLAPRVYLQGSSLVNQCVDPLNVECNDVDVAILFYLQEELSSYRLTREIGRISKRVDQAFVATVNRLLSRQNSLPFTEAEGVYVSPSYWLNPAHFLWGYEFPAALEYHPSNSPPVYIKGASSYLPLQCSVHVKYAYKSIPIPYHPLVGSGSPTSFFVDIDLFEQGLGSLVGGEYLLSSVEGDCLKAIAEVRSKIFSCHELDPTRGKWGRFLMKITEGFIDPVIQNNQFFFLWAVKRGGGVIEPLKSFIQKKRTLPNYALFCLLNAFFHARDESNAACYSEGLEEEFLKEIYEALQKVSQEFSWALELAALYSLCPRSQLPALLKELLPLVAHTVSERVHLEKMQRHCEYTCQGNRL
ncbi:MAG: hypothetical protein FJZ58_07000, partial [Chlamydiae bacterium]|nr:hypothetical protein [Chlamydiota bacterium]